MNLDVLPKEVLQEVFLLEQQKKKLDTRDIAQKNFLAYAQHVYEGFIVGRHHKIIAEKLERIAKGELKRLIVNMPPRHLSQRWLLISCLRGSWAAIRS